MTRPVPLAVIRKMTVKDLRGLREQTTDATTISRIDIEIGRRMDRIPVNLPHREDTTT
jgi:hypothetical protein